MQPLLRALAVAGLALAIAEPVAANSIVITFTGIAGDGGFGAPWGFDAFGQNIIGDPYTAVFKFDTSLATVSSAGGINTMTETGLAYGRLTIGGHTYTATGSTFAAYTRSADFIGVTFYDDPAANSGVVLQAPTSNTAAIDPNLGASLATLALAPADVAASGIDAVLGLDGGALFAVTPVETVTVSGVPEPATWGLMLTGVLGLGLALRRSSAGAPV